MWLLLVDSHSKWPGVFEVTKITATKTIEILRQVFAAYGLPEQLVSVNGPQFTVKSLQSSPLKMELNTYSVPHTILLLPGRWSGLYKPLNKL